MIPESAKRFPTGKHDFNFMIWSNWESAEDSEKNIRWTREFWGAMQPYLISSSYGNHVSDEGDESARTAYGANYERLAALKKKYDPTNLFRMNHNIKPEKAAQAMTSD